MAETEVHRDIDGASADFTAGCALLRFDVNSSVRISNQLFIKSDANTILVSWQPGKNIDYLMIKGILQSIAGPLRFCHRSSPSMRGRYRKNTIAGFYQPEHAQAALKHFNGSSDREAILVYTVYFTASEELSNAVLMETVVGTTMFPQIQTVWEDVRDGMVTLRLAGTGRTEVRVAKRMVEYIYAGRIVTANSLEPQYELWHDFFATLPGEIWLRHLAREMGCLILSDKLQQRLRMYGCELDHPLRGTPVIEQKILNKINELDAREETHSISLDHMHFRKLIASNTILQLQEKLGPANVNLDIVRKALVLRCTHQTASLITNELGLPRLPSPDTLAQPECSQCGGTSPDIQFFTCRHSVCRDCFDHQIKVASSDLTSNLFPLVCWHEGCEQPIAIPDLRKLVTTATLDTLLKAALTYHIRSFPDIYRSCPTPDCRAVYLSNGSYEIFTCPECLVQRCTLCHEEAHVGWTCAQYQSHLHKTQLNEHLLEDYKAAAGTKDCPKCSTLIEKIDGCNHVECSGCHGHICWVCLRMFAKADSAYQHMNDVHGGNGLPDLDEEENDDSDDLLESSGEEEDSYDLSWEEVY